MRDKVRRQCPQTTTSEEKAEPKQPDALPLGQTGSLTMAVVVVEVFLYVHRNRRFIRGGRPDDELMLNVLRCHLTY